MNSNTPLWQLTVGEFQDLVKSCVGEANVVPPTKKYCYGLDGIASVLGCSRSSAARYKRLGFLDGAITQVGKSIVIDSEKAIEMLKKNKARR
ncbi:MAG: DUF3853 family protein [Paludibacteraceae bacterium]|nr:DUF3853 family protein [Paludibacteraceae bacterium]